MRHSLSNIVQGVTDPYSGLYELAKRLPDSLLYGKDFGPFQSCYWGFEELASLSADARLAGVHDGMTRDQAVAELDGETVALARQWLAKHAA